MEVTLSPAPATTAEEAMASSGDSEERGIFPGENTASSGDTQCPAGAPAGREEATSEVEQWAAAVPPVRNKGFPGLHGNTGLMPFAIRVCQARPSSPLFLHRSNLLIRPSLSEVHLFLSFYNTGLHNEMKVVAPSPYTHITYLYTNI